MLRRLFVVLAAAGVAWLGVYRLQSRPLPRFVSRGKPPHGVFHVHSSLSHDGRKSLQTIVDAAHDLGLDFVVVTDHNTQHASKGGSLSIVAGTELSTPFGHVIALGAGEPLPESERHDLQIHAAVRRAGGVPFVAHPTDRRRPWDGSTEGAAGLEIANTATSLRRYGGPLFAPLLPLLVAVRVRPDLALMQLYDPDSALRLWDRESDPRVVGLCGADAHGRTNLSMEMRIWQIVLEQPLPPDPLARPAAIVKMMQEGRFHCVGAVLGDSPRFEFYAERGGETTARAGDTVAEADAIVIQGPQLRSGAAVLVLLRDGEEVMRVRGDTLHYAAPGPGTYRAEVRVTVPGLLWGERSVPVIYSNRIRLAHD